MKPMVVLPCWDESDNGIPSVCLDSRARCPFHPDNPMTNNNLLCHVLGNVGYSFFDRNRKKYMGIAMWSTVAAMFVTSYGALSLSTDPDVVKASYWAKIVARPKESQHVNATTRYYIGLRAMVVVGRGETRVDRLGLDYGSLEQDDEDDGSFAEHSQVVSACRDAAAGNQLGAFLACVTLVFALLGTVNRMRFSADANVQKSLGLVMDSWGALSLSLTLWNFKRDCFADVSSGHSTLEYSWGPGWLCYLFCALSGTTRALFHWLAPTPGNGAGACTFTLPRRILDLLDVDGDGAITWHDQRAAFNCLREKINRHQDTKNKARRTGLFSFFFFFFKPVRRRETSGAVSPEVAVDRDRGPAAEGRSLSGADPLVAPLVRAASVPTFVLLAEEQRRLESSSSRTVAPRSNDDERPRRPTAPSSIFPTTSDVAANNNNDDEETEAAAIRHQPAPLDSGGGGSPAS